MRRRFPISRYCPRCGSRSAWECGLGYGCHPDRICLDCSQRYTPRASWLRICLFLPLGCASFLMGCGFVVVSILSLIEAITGLQLIAKGRNGSDPPWFFLVVPTLLIAGLLFKTSYDFGWRVMRTLIDRRDPPRGFPVIVFAPRDDVSSASPSPENDP